MLRSIHRASVATQWDATQKSWDFKDEVYEQIFQDGGEVILSKQNNLRDVSKVCNSRVDPRATGNVVFAKHQHSGQRKVGDGGINSLERLVCHTAGLTPDILSIFQKEMDKAKFILHM